MLLQFFSATVRPSHLRVTAHRCHGSHMDDIVLRGLAKWPDVPAVYGWLTLDRRGNWLIKGDSISNAAVTAFIGRNYERDPEGRWFFQNGPQRVYVALAYTPLVYRVVNGDGAALAIESHTGARANSLT